MVRKHRLIREFPLEQKLVPHCSCAYVLYLSVVTRCHHIEQVVLRMNGGEHIAQVRLRLGDVDTSSIIREGE